MKNVLLLLVFTLSAYSLSAQCVFIDAGQQADYEALMALYNATDGPNWTDNTGWANGAVPSDCFPCDNVPVAWKGVICSGGRVTRIQLENNNLNGTIPAELGSLGSLQSLRLGVNSLSGPIPPELGSLGSLQSLSLSVNSLSGPIPPELGSLGSLQSLSLSSNSLSGPIPPELGNLGSLRLLRLRFNSLSGPIPPELGSLGSLQYLSLTVNSLSGPIPPELGSLGSLQSLDLDRNSLSGPIPPELGSLGSLESLDLDRNSLSGPIPPELGSLGSLESLSLYSNSLSGPIPPELGNLNLGLFGSLDLGGNSLSGPIPPELGNLNLGLFGSLDLGGNSLSGPIPPELGNLNLGLFGSLDLGINSLSGCFPQSLCDLLNNGTSVNLIGNSGLPGGGSLTALQEFCDNGSVGTEICGDGMDNNCDGQVDEGCCALVLGCKETYTVALPITGSITVQASELDDNSSGCGALAYAVSGASSLTLGCGDIGAQEVTLAITDTEGNSGNCTVELVLEDNNPDADADAESDACDDAFSIDTKIASMIGYINGLGLTGGQANSLIRKLQHAFDKYCGGQSHVALNQLNAFVNHVQSLEADGVLSPAAAAELIAGANAMIDAISSGTAIDGCPVQSLAAPAEGSSPAASAVGLRLFPNPVRRQLHFTLQAPEDTPGQARVYNLQGQLLLSRSLSLNKGLNTDYLEVSGFQDGLYLLEVRFGGEQQQRRFVVQK